MCKYGYVRVSSKDQNPERQLEGLIEHGITEKSIFVDKVSGKDFERPNYKALISCLNTGDVLVIKSIDRLGRNYKEIIEQWRFLCLEKQVDIEVLDFPLLNTTQQRDGLTGTFIADMVLQVLAYVAELERDNIRQRQAEGIAIAKAKGVRFGRKEMELPKGFETACYKCLNGELSIRTAAKILDMCPATFFRKYKAWNNEK